MRLIKIACLLIGLLLYDFNIKLGILKILEISLLPRNLLWEVITQVVSLKKHSTNIQSLKCAITHYKV
jgi:hypothetical protein